MIKKEGNILKMRSVAAQPLNYFLPLGNHEVLLNELIGKTLNMQFAGQINCVSCGKQTKTSFGQGFCYNCLQSSPLASESVLRPELSKAHLGIARDMEWATRHDLIDHYVYLALSSDVKVGVTRHHQIPTRWIDQGASSAILLAKTPNRHIAGIIEVFLKQYFTDKTNWREMLQNIIASHFSLICEKQKAVALLPAELQQYVVPSDEITEIEYPVISYPQKINSLSFDKTPIIEGILTGIKGQYLLFGEGSVLNIQKHSGYYIKLQT